MALKLLYNFSSTPVRIIASAPGNGPLNVVNLEVMITNPTTSPIQLTSISIQIPCGGKDANMLSEDPALPSPTYDPNSGWSGSTSGDTVTFTLPHAGISDSKSFIFNLSGIQVNRAPGTVRITIVEDGEKRTIDDNTYSLVKHPNTAPITNFHATLNPDETAKLFWECTAAGSNYAYAVHSDTWNTQQPDACINHDICNSCADGTTGIQTTPLTSETTIFYLNVIQKNNDGSRTLYQTNRTTVQMAMPNFSAAVAQVYLSGRLMRLHWTAHNAAYCTVELDEQTVLVSNAPTDTFANGYWITLSTPIGGLHQVSVTAHATIAPGSAQVQHKFPFVTLDSIVTMPIGGNQFLAITPDGTKALVPGSSSVALVDIASLTVSATLNVSGTPSGVAITPYGKLAFMTVSASNNIDQVIVINLPGMTIAKSIGFVGSSGVTSVAITPDGKLALVCIGFMYVLVIDIKTLTRETNAIKTGDSPTFIAITPDGTLALTTNIYTVSVIDIASRSPLTSFHCLALGIAITPDGSFALAVDSWDNTVSIIDISSRSVVATIPVGNGPRGIAIVSIPNVGPFALVANNADSTISFIDIQNKVALPVVLNVPANPIGIAVVPNSSHFLISSTTTLTKI
jgi:YVTN family beta-propeller protein